MLKDQKYAADRAARYHLLAWLRTLEGYFGAATFYQHLACVWHVRACEYRDQINESLALTVAPPRVSSDWFNYHDKRPCYSPQQKAPHHA